MDDAIKRALEVATRKACGLCECPEIQPGCLGQVADEIAAFHDTVADHPATCAYDAATHRMQAAAVRRAAGGG